ncbi:MAG: glutamate cyclase domain-containing protein [Janthinobacterium lividum]
MDVNSGRIVYDRKDAKLSSMVQVGAAAPADAVAPAARVATTARTSNQPGKGTVAAKTHRTAHSRRASAPDLHSRGSTRTLFEQKTDSLGVARPGIDLRAAFPQLPSTFAAMAGSQPLYRPRPVTPMVCRTMAERKNSRVIANVDALLRSYNARGIHDLLRALGVGGLQEAVEVLDRSQHAWLSTGFNVLPGKPETDGPPGLAALGFALRLLGKQVRFICDSINLELVCACMQTLDPQAEAHYEFTAMDEKDDLAPARAIELFDNAPCDVSVALELTGRSADGIRRDMRANDINPNNAAVDQVQNEANRRGIATLSIFDGGNESGSGGTLNVPLAANGTVIAAAIVAQSQVHAWNSNLGGFALAEILLARHGLSKRSMTEIQLASMIQDVMALGGIDGVTRGSVADEYVHNHLGIPGKTEQSGVDGFGIRTHQVFLEMLKKLVREIIPVEAKEVS